MDQNIIDVFVFIKLENQKKNSEIEIEKSYFLSDY